VGEGSVQYWPILNLCNEITKFTICC
jgi:hypothetical protein